MKGAQNDKTMQIMFADDLELSFKHKCGGERIEHGRNYHGRVSKRRPIREVRGGTKIYRYYDAKDIQTLGRQR